MKVIYDDPLCPLPPSEADCKAILLPKEAAKLIKFYLNLYPDLVGTLTEYFPKQTTNSKGQNSD